jgi:predicted HicB family RNase H-like nuclease
VRLRGREPNFVVTSPSLDQSFEDAAEGGFEAAYSSTALSESGPPSTEEGATARINFRVPEQLKVAIEEAAGKEGRSVNAWLVRVASAALQHQDRDYRSERRGKRGPQRYTGWVR